MRSSRKAHVIIPTYSAHDTLRFAVLSALDQSLPPDTITIIGDGATQKVSSLAEELSKEFSIVQFLDKPKLGNRGENYRDEVIKSSDADFISYLCDDDLYMPNHLEQMSEHLQEFDFVHPRPTFVNPDGTFFFLPSGIEIPKIKAWHRLDPPQNTISLTGASHTRRSYLSLEKGWDAGPPEIWTDLYMWVKFFSDQEVKTFTSPLTTTIKLMYTKNDRDLHNRNNLIKYWYNITRQPDQLAPIYAHIETQLKEISFDKSVLIERLNAVIAERDAQLKEISFDKSVLTERLNAVIAERNAVLNSTIWKLMQPYRKLKSIFRD